MTMAALSGALAYAAFTALAFARVQHFRAIRGVAPSQATVRRLQITGWLLMGGGAVAAGAAWPAAIAGPAYLGVLSVAALLLVMLLAFRPRIAAPLAVIAPLLALLIP